MDPNVRTEQKHVVVNSPGQRREIVTERRERDRAGLSTGAIALIAVLALAAIAVYAISSLSSMISS
jgi:hypothetical protein